MIHCHTLPTGGHQLCTNFVFTTDLTSSNLFSLKKQENAKRYHRFRHTIRQTPETLNLSWQPKAHCICSTKIPAVPSPPANICSFTLPCHRRSSHPGASLPALCRPAAATTGCVFPARLPSQIPRQPPAPPQTCGALLPCRFTAVCSTPRSRSF